MIAAASSKPHRDLADTCHEHSVSGNGLHPAEGDKIGVGPLPADEDHDAPVEEAERATGSLLRRGG